MYKKENNYAFIDAQNVHKGTQELGHTIDWKKFYIYLKEKYSVTKALIFIGYIPIHQKFYNFLEKTGYTLIFKPVILHQKIVKGNCDGDMILHTMIELHNFDNAIIVTGDGDFYSLIRYLYTNKKLKIVLSPNIKKCSTLLKQESREKIKDMKEIKTIYRDK